MTIPAPAAAQKRRRKVHKEPVSPWLAIAILSLFSLATALYLLANHRQEAFFWQITGNVPAISIVNEENEVDDAAPRLALFLSQDDFKSYLDAGRRSAGEGLFEAQKKENAAKNEVKAPNNKTTAKDAAAAAIDPQAARDYFSLGLNSFNFAGDIAHLNQGKLYFSPKNQFYWPASAIASRPVGQTFVFSGDGGQFEQTKIIPQDGNFIVADNSLAVFLNNSLAVYDVGQDAVGELWRGRINDGSQIVGSEFFDGKLYLAVKTAIDFANPCPARPLLIADKAAAVECSSIYHPAAPIAADSIFTVFAINPRTGEVSRDISFAGKDKDFIISLGGGAAWIAWSESQDQIAFFADFLAAKCKGLLPAYILENAAALAKNDISRAAKEFELRQIFSGWFESLAASERERIAGEINNRLSDYLRDQRLEFEKTGIAKIDLKIFSPVARAAIAGRLPGADFAAWDESGLRLVAVSGVGAAQKLSWLISGEIILAENEKTQNAIYLFDQDLRRIGENRDMDISQGICAVRFVSDIACARTCRADAPLYILSFNPQAMGLRGNFSLPAGSGYFYPAREDTALAIHQDGRKIKIALLDLLPFGGAREIDNYSLNAYWADFAANAEAFAHCQENKLIFIPAAARGGSVVSYADGQIILKKTGGEIAPSRALFEGGKLYLAGDGGIEVLGGENFDRLALIKF